MKKYIGYYENIVEDKICDSIISYTEKSKVLTPSTYSTSAGKSARSSDRVSMSDSWFKNAIVMDNNMDTHKYPLYYF